MEGGGVVGQLGAGGEGQVAAVVAGRLAGAVGGRIVVRGDGGGGRGLVPLLQVGFVLRHTLRL